MTFANVFITGASSGLGRGLALYYAREGSTVFACARRKAALDSLVQETQNASGKIIPIVLDVLDTAALVAAIETAQETAGGALDLVIANAGFGQPTHGLKLDWRKVKQLLDVNITAACVTIAAALPAMVKRGRGTVVGISSLASLRGLPGSATYCASKAALSIFLESLRVDLAGTRVKALCIQPGYVKTELTAKVKHAMPFLMELDDAVKVMARGISREQGVIAFPLPINAFMRLVRGLPRFVYEPLAGRFGPKPKL